MNFTNHPLAALVRTFPIHSDEWKGAERMAAELAHLLGILAAMQPGDPTAAATLKHASALLASIHQTYGRVHGWSLAQQATIFAEANRLCPAGHDHTAPNWTEAY